MKRRVASSVITWGVSAWLAVLALHAPVAAQRVLNELQPARAFVGQEVRFVVQAQGAREAECKLEDVEGLTFELQDRGVTGQSTQISIVNGRREVHESANYTFVYRVIAERPGRYAIPPPRVTVEGVELRGSRCTLELEDPADDDRVAIELHCDPPQLVLGQSAKLTVDVFLAQLPPEINASEPLSLYDQGRSFSFFDQGTPPPELRLPWLVDPPQGLGPIDLESWVRARQVQTGFRLQGVRGGRFLESGEVRDVERPKPGGGTRRYRRYRFGFDVRGEVAGTYRFAPATLQGALVTRSGSRFVWSDAFARSAPLSLEVVEPPAEGRPATFSGAVGRFSFAMEPPTPTSIRLGDAVYVTLVVKGAGFLKGVGLDLGAQLGPGFRVERVGVTDSLAPGVDRPPGFPDRPGQWRQWDFKVYPVSATVDAIPAVAFSWFDPERATYATESTRPVPITVQAASAGGSDVVVANSANTSRKDVELVPTSALSANVTDLNLLAERPSQPWVAFGVLAALPVAYLLTSLFVRRRRRLHDDPALLRRRRAGARAAARLRAARQEPGATSIAQAHAALRGFVADLEGRDEEALTSEELEGWLRGRGVDGELQARVTELCEAVEAAAYGGAVGSGERAAELIAGLERVFQVAAKAAAPLFLAIALLAVASPAQDVSVFNEAQAAFDSKDFTKAAQAYERAIADGYENGYVLYDLGNAWLRAGELGRAIAAYRRASLFLPGDANIEVNLRRALEARRDPLSPPDERSVLDYVMFWRRRVSSGAEVQLALGLGVAAFVLALGRLLSGRRLPAVKWTALLLAAASLLLAISAALDHRALVARDRAVVVADGTVLRTGPGDTFDARYEQPLGEGAEVEIQGRREGWLKVLAGGQYEGWLPESAAATW